MTDAAKVAALRELSERATPGPWTLCPDLLGCGCGHGTQSIDARDGNTLVAEFRDLTNPPDESDSNNTEPIETRRTNAALIVALVNAYRDGLLVSASDSGEVAGLPNDDWVSRITEIVEGQATDEEIDAYRLNTEDPTNRLLNWAEWQNHALTELAADLLRAALTRPVSETPEAPESRTVFAFPDGSVGPFDGPKRPGGRIVPAETPKAAPSSETCGECGHPLDEHYRVCGTCDTGRGCEGASDD